MPDKTQPEIEINYIPKVDGWSTPPWLMDESDLVELPYTLNDRKPLAATLFLP